MFGFFVLGASTYLLSLLSSSKRDFCWCHGSSSWSPLEWPENNSPATRVFGASGYGQFEEYCSSVFSIR